MIQPYSKRLAPHLIIPIAEGEKAHIGTVLGEPAHGNEHILLIEEEPMQWVQTLGIKRQDHGEDVDKVFPKDTAPVKPVACGTAYPGSGDNVWFDGGQVVNGRYFDILNGRCDNWRGSSDRVVGYDGDRLVGVVMGLRYYSENFEPGEVSTLKGLGVAVQDNPSADPPLPDPFKDVK